MSLIQMTFKILLLGDTNVGKTSYILRVCDDIFEEELTPTIGVDFKEKRMKIDNQVQATIEVWDTAGQERFKSISHSMIKKADGMLLLYDVTNRQSFINVTNWIETIHNNSSSKNPIVLVGNKCDQNKRVVEYNDGKVLAGQYNITFYEASCKTNFNVIQSLEQIASTIYKNKITQGTSLKEKNINSKLNNNDKKKQKCC